MKLLAAFALGTLAGLTAHLALGYLRPVRVAVARMSAADFAAVRRMSLSRKDADDRYVDEPGGGWQW